MRRPPVGACVEGRSEAYRAPTRAPRLLGAGVVVFLGAILVARLLLRADRTEEQVATLAVAAPLLFLLLWGVVGARAGAVLAALFLVAVVALRAFLVAAPIGWPALLLVPVVAFTLYLAGRTVRDLRKGREEPDAPIDGEEK